MVYSSRILIERVLRDQVRALSNVDIREDATVGGLTVRDGRITGVDFGEHVDADLVVDAMGRGSSVSSWLVAAGWPEPEGLTPDAKATYTSRRYDLPCPPPTPRSRA